MAIPLVMRKRGTLDLIEFPDFGLADYSAPILAEGFDPDQRMMRAIWNEAKRRLPAADVVRFVKMPSTVNGRRNPLTLLDGVGRSPLTAWSAGLGAPEESWAQAIACPRRRVDLDARWRKLNKRGAVRFSVARTPVEAGAIFSALCEQRGARFRASGQPNSLEKEDVRAFFRRLALSGDNVVLQSLTVEGQIVAAGYGFVANGAFAMIFPSFRAEGFRNYSPGLQLFRKSLEWAAGQGLHTYDFTIGAEAFKRDFGARPEPLYERYEALSLRGLGLVGAARLRRSIAQRPGLARLCAGVKPLISFRGAA